MGKFMTTRFLERFTNTEPHPLPPSKPRVDRGGDVLVAPKAFP